METNQLKELLKEHLSVSVECNYCGSVRVKLYFDNEEISSDYDNVNMDSNPYDD